MKLSSSSLSVFRECPRKWQYTYVYRRVRTTDSPALSLGRAVHKAIEHLLNSGRDSMLSYLHDVSADIDEQQAAIVAAMLVHYRAPDLEILGVEQDFEIPVVDQDGATMNGYTLQGRIDAVARDLDGCIWVVEHKTTTQEIQGYGPYWRKLSVDHQIAFYCLAIGAVGCVYDVLKKPTLRIKQGETEPEFERRYAELVAKSKSGRSSARRKMPETIDEYLARCVEQLSSRYEYYAQRMIYKTADDLREAQRDLWQQVSMLDFCLTRGMFPRNSGSCQGVYGYCEYLDVCTGCASLDDDEIFRGREYVE